MNGQTVLFVPDVARLEAVLLACCPLAPASDPPQTHQRAWGPECHSGGRWGRRRAGVAAHGLLPCNHPICSCPPARRHQLPVEGGWAEWMPNTLDKKLKAGQTDRTHFPRGLGGRHLGSQTPLGSRGARFLGVPSLSRGPAERKQADHGGGGGEALYSESFGQAPAERSPSWGPPGVGGWEQPCQGPINTSPQATGVAPRIPRHVGCWEAIKTSSTAEGAGEAGEDWLGDSQAP